MLLGARGGGGDDSAVLRVDGGRRVGILVQDVDHDGGGTQVVGRAGVVARVPGVHMGEGQRGVSGVDLNPLVSVVIVVDHPVVVVPGMKKGRELIGVVIQTTCNLCYK